MNAKKFVNLSKFLLAGALVLGMTACSSDDDITNGGTDNKVNTYMTVTISGNTLQKTLSGTGTNARTSGTNEENAISSLKVILVNTLNNVGTVESTFTLGVTSTGTDPVETNVVKTTPFAVKTGTYKVYVIANPSNKFPDITVGTTEASLLSTINSTSMDQSDYAANNNFLMTNAINYQGDVSNIKEVTVSSTNTQAAPATVSIVLDRMAAKINLGSTCKYSFDKVNYGDINITTYTDPSNLATRTTKQLDIHLSGYSLINLFNKANLYQKWLGTSSTQTESELATPNYVSSYPSTSNFTLQKDYFSTRTANAGTATASTFDVLEDKATGLLNTITNSSLIATAAPTYCLENNAYQSFSNGNYWTKNDAQVTGVLFQAQAVEHGNNTPVSFYSYNGKYYLTLADVQAEWPGVFDGLTGTDKLAAAVLLPASDLRAKCAIHYYKTGYMYYTYYIKDKQYTEKDNNTNSTTFNTQVNYYSIMRNSIYSLNVLRLLRIGDDIPFGWVATSSATPIDAADAYMDVELKVNQWVLNKYDFDLK